MTRLPGIVLCCLLLCVAACSPPQDDVIRFGLASAPANLDPRYATDATSARLNRLLYQRLVDFDETIRPVPALASWELLSPVHYRFHLNPGRAPFHDGKPTQRPGCCRNLSLGAGSGQALTSCRHIAADR